MAPRDRALKELGRVAERLLYPTGSGSRCSDGGARHLSLPGQILPRERGGGTGPGNHAALVLPAGRKPCQYTVFQPEGEGARMSRSARRFQGQKVGQRSVPPHPCGHTSPKGVVFNNKKLLKIGQRWFVWMKQSRMPDSQTSSTGCQE